MERRELLKMIALATGGVVIGGEFLLSGCKNEHAASGINFSADDIALLDEVGETIIPATNTPGAKAAKIGEFMKTMVTDCYTAADQKAFVDGIKQLNDACEKMNNTDFIKANAEQRKKLLVSLNEEAKKYQDAKNDREKDKREKSNKEHDKTFEFEPNHYFTMMKQLTIFGFFTSKTGATETLRYVAVPGKFDGSYPYKKGDKAWATT